MGLDAAGIELLPKRFQASCAAVESLRALPRPREASKKLEFFQGSITQLDFSDADVLFVQNLCYDAALMDRVSAAAKAMKKGARVLTYAPFRGPDFQKLGAFEVGMSFQKTNTTFNLLEKVTEPRAADANP